ETVESTAGLLAPTAQAKSLALEVAIDPAARRGFRGDPMRIRQVLLNLLANAVKFTEAGRGAVAVSAHADTAGRITVGFVVVETGIGIPREVRERLFQNFTQADGSIARRFGGTGLGLAISKQLVELMGGRIGVESEPGQGSRFWFELTLTA